MKVGGEVDLSLRGDREAVAGLNNPPVDRGQSLQPREPDPDRRRPVGHRAYLAETLAGSCRDPGHQ